MSSNATSATVSLVSHRVWSQCRVEHRLLGEKLVSIVSDKSDDAIWSGHAILKVSGEDPEICSLPELAAASTELDSSHGNTTDPSSLPNEPSFHAEGQMGASTPTALSPTRSVQIASKEDCFGSSGLPIYHFLKPPVRPPAETLYFLANFTQDAGIVTLLGDRRYPLDHDSEGLDQPHTDVMFDLPEIDLNHSQIFNPQDLDTGAVPFDAGVCHTFEMAADHQTLTAFTDYRKHKRLSQDIPYIAFLMNGMMMNYCGSFVMVPNIGGYVPPTFRNLVQCHVKHEDLSLLTVQSFNWQKFVETEEMIRILLWVFLLDTAFVVFNNTPPQLALREISTGLASSERCFQAETSSACLDQIQQWVARAGNGRSPSMYSLFQRFCSYEMDQDDINRVAHEGFINLWCVVCAFLSMTFYLDPLTANGHSFQSVQRGLTNWKLVWNQRLLNRDEHYFDVQVTEQQHQQTPSDESVTEKRPPSELD
ncbi:hypothetical protein B0A52_01996 [Exophiala mesophila]|uniref:Transcription factor domain-containing protein n=1 Tax=Exophiala mesophila TaxID=212818 RepID=A0A438NEN8_EXOME|nr:hypothetical protein B0A52_01996 [Exophiala mesophila]